MDTKTPSRGSLAIARQKMFLASLALAAGILFAATAEYRPPLWFLIAALAFATGAGTTTSQCFQPHKTFPAVLPFDGQFVADLLNIRRSHDHSVMSTQNLRPHASLYSGESELELSNFHS